MNPALIDTSVWIDFFRGRENYQTKLTKEYIENEFSVFTCPIIVQEVLQGIREDTEYEKVKRNLLNLDILLIDQIESSVGVADLYRSLRKKGVTIKKSNDCMIAYYAIHFGIHLLHKDSDFDLIAGKTNLKVL